ncbi:AAA family ATPase [Methanocalculus sp. MC3]
MGRIHTLHIENFRAIGSLDYAPRQLNIICGKNNTGKTALLDAIYINRTGGARRRFFEEGIIENLIKTDKSKAIVHSNLNHVKIYRSLNIIRNEDPKAYDQIRDYIIQILLMDIEDDDFREAYLGVIFESIDFIVIISDLGNQFIPYYLIDKQFVTEQLEQIISNIGEIKGYEKLLGFTDTMTYTFLLKSFRNYSSSDSSINKKEESIIKISHKEKLSPKRMDDEEIHLLEQFIKEHNLVRNLERLTQNNVLYKRGDEIETIPISAHGDGFITLLSLFHYLRKSQDGILLIEEPENHLHPEYLAIFIETLFTYAPKLNVQVFMTTHSYDLIQTALDYPEDDAEKELLLISKMTSDGETIEKYDYTVDEGRRVTEELKLDLRGI